MVRRGQPAGANFGRSRVTREMDEPLACPPDEVRGFVKELLRTGLALTDLLSTLLEDLPENAFPGEEPGEVLICGSPRSGHARTD
jgi:hypothetical protein